MQTIANLRSWLNATDRVKGFDMRLHDVTQYVQGTSNMVVTRRKNTEGIAFSSIHIWFVDRYPEIAEVTQRLHSMLDIAHKIAYIADTGKPATVGKPQGVGEVMQRYDWPNMQTT